jgi:hypothetical protein
VEIKYKTDAEFYIFGRTQASYPLGFPTVGEEQIPLLKKLGVNAVPRDLRRFDQPSRVTDFSDTGVHFFSDDSKFQQIILYPERYVEKFSKYKVVITPDVTVSADMPPSVRVQNIRTSRQVGAVWESRGLEVIPSLRWACREDYDIAFSGIELNSIVAVGTYGAIQDKNLRTALLDGLEEILVRIQPAAVLLYGALDNHSLARIRQSTQVFQYFPPMWDKKLPVERELDSYSLFEGL